ncbi:MAG: type III-B CRISPR module RAMP protein Cmr4 [Synergistaceae bacterium]|jgi:CRISPR-associated protein Cmr4|nr:type III-B CRISPR module RAMP protein Cmr4 [Synergistaceae bacterium]
MNAIFGEKVYWLHAVSPLHVGTGRGGGYIDIPAVREKGTGWPYVPGSAVRGVIADKNGAAEGSREKGPDGKGTRIGAAFGRSGKNKDSGPVDATAGSLVFSDATIVCLPVRTFCGTFAWLTSPFALDRLRCADKPKAPGRIVENGDILTAENSKISQDSKVYFENSDLDARRDAKLGEWGQFIAENVFAGSEEWQDIFKARFALVHDDVFTSFCKTGTQIDARIGLDGLTKTTLKRSLWYEESLPAGTILAGVVWCDKVYGNRFTPEDLLEEFCRPYAALQIGGNASTGKGQVRCVFS